MSVWIDLIWQIWQIFRNFRNFQNFQNFHQNFPYQTKCHLLNLTVFLSAIYLNSNKLYNLELFKLKAFFIDSNSAIQLGLSISIQKKRSINGRKSIKIGAFKSKFKSIVQTGGSRQTITIWLLFEFSSQ